MIGLNIFISILDAVDIHVPEISDKTDKEKEKHQRLKPCSCKYRKCYEKFSEEDLDEIHASYWSNEIDIRRQWVYCHVKKFPPKRRYGDFDDQPIKNFSNFYYLPNQNEDINVCRYMFLSTLGYSNTKFIRTAFKNIQKGFTQGDKRGKHAPPHKMSEDDNKFIKDHINKYNPSISHYRREHSPNRLYLPSELTIREMYNDYINECKENNHKTFHYSVYCKILKEMNISFAKLGVEECEQCDAFPLHKTEVLKNDEKGEVLLKKTKNKASNNHDWKCSDLDCFTCLNYNVHVNNYNEARIDYNNDKELQKKNQDTIYMSTDLQKVVLLPRLPGYKKCLFTRRLIIYNQTFAPIGKFKTTKKKPVGNLWHEGISGRNDEDISSGFLKVISSKQYRDYAHWVIWMDNCGGQNKCWTLYTMLAWYMYNDCAPKTITLKYFTPGHSFMSADNFHHQVEKQMKLKDKVYDFNDFVDCVSTVGEAILMHHSDFKNFEKGLSQGKLAKKTTPLLANVKIAQFHKCSTSLYYKEKLTDKDFKEAFFLQQKIERAIKNKCKDYTGREVDKGINPEKKNNIKELFDLLPPNRRVFYANLKTNENEVD